MTEAERAAALADEIEIQARVRKAACLGDWYAAWSFEESGIIARALRAYSAPVSTDAGLREAVAKAIRYADGCGLSHGGETRFCDDPVFSKAFDAAGRSLRQDKCQCRVGAAAALSAIHASGWRIVPKEPTEDDVERAIKTATTYRLSETDDEDCIYWTPTSKSMRAALVEYATLVARETKP